MNEPVAGYTVRERIGTGGYGEVWKADAPGGLSKAIKFVYGQLDDERAGCELKALNRIKEVRHPFLLSLERIEVVDGQLLIITELADMSLKDRFRQCCQQGLAGIPRDELLVYLRDAADALDYMSEHYSLQHLDVKPENLLIVGGRVKVADFGLVREIASQTMTIMGGLTPVYAAPESFQGHPSRHSDQYSLAIVYQEMLTGVLPFPGKTTSQLMAQHLRNRPRLAPLPESDRAAIARALAKDPEERFPSCRAMIESLLAAGNLPPEHPPAEEEPATEEPDTRSDVVTLVARQPPASAGPAPDSGNRDSAWSEPGLASSGPGLAASPVGSWGGDHPPMLATLPLDEVASQDVGPLCRAEPTSPPPTIDPFRKSCIAEWIDGPGPEAGVSYLPPVEIPDAKPRLRPTLFLGIGGTAARTLRRLHQRLHDRLGSLAAVPALDLLLVDTDLSVATQATQGEEAGALKPRQTLGLPLRSPHEYREGSEKLLQWMSRRWLYNIPRSLQTEGVRPLGRLALVDHAEEFFKRVRSTIKAMVDPEAIAASKQAFGLESGNPSPRVFLIASISGGTGGGMVLDVAYAVRKVLGELGLADDELYGVLTHSTIRNPSAKDLALANAYACLSELQHYSTGAGYPGDPACGLPPCGRNRPPLRELYLVHLGDDLSDEQFDEATDALAEYLYLDTVTAAGKFFDAWRRPAGSSSRGVSVRTFGLGQVGFAQSNLPVVATELLCQNLVQRWLGEGDSPKDSSFRVLSQKQDPAEFAAAGSPLQSSTEQLLKDIHAMIEQELGGDSEATLRAAFERLLVHPEGGAAAGGPGPDSSAPLDAIGSLLGDRTATGDTGSTGPGRLQVMLAGRLKELAAHQGTALCDWLYERIDTSASRVEGALLASQWAAERLRTLESEAEAAVRQEAVRIAQMEQILLEADSHQRSRPRSWLGFGRGARRAAALNDGWLAYFRLRLEQTAYRGICALARSMRAKVAAVGDGLAELRKRLFVLADQFEAKPFWNEADCGDLALPGMSSDPYQAMAERLRHRLPDLTAKLDDHFRTTLFAEQGGLQNLLNSDGDLQGILPGRLRSAARSAILAALKELDLPKIFFQGVAESGAMDPALRGWLAKALPRLPACGGARRLLLVCPEGSDQQQLGQVVRQLTHQQPSLVFDSDVNLVLCCEAQDMSLTRAASALLGDRADCARIAPRLHTRIDVAWSPMPTVS